MTTKRTPDLHPELREHLLERLDYRARRLTGPTVRKYPQPVLAMMTQQVTLTALLLCGDEFVEQLLEKILGWNRVSHGICKWCGERPVQGDRLCAVCWAEMDAIDRDISEARDE